MRNLNVSKTWREEIVKVKQKDITGAKGERTESTPVTHRSADLKSPSSSLSTNNNWDEGKEKVSPYYHPFK